jgi:hypothetical protein
MNEAPINDFTAAEWEALKRLHANTCAYCGSEGALTRDHVKPLAKGGSNTLANIVPACLSCNSAKRDADDWTPNPPPPFNGPLCACGCGLPAPIADDVSIQGGAVKGRSRRYVAGHTIRPPGPVNTENGDGK